MEKGLEALTSDITAKLTGKSRVVKKGDTLKDLIFAYAPPSENDSKAYADTVATQLGVPLDTKVENLQDRVNDLVKAIVSVESPQAFSQIYEEN